MICYKNRKGFLLIGVLFLTIATGIVGVVAMSLLAKDVDTNVGVGSSAKAFYIANAGLEYVMENLSTDSNWTDNTTSISKNFAGGSFTVNYQDIQANSIKANIQGSYSGTNRYVARTFTRIPSAFDYMVYSNGSFGASCGSGNLSGDIASGGAVDTGNIVLNSSTNILENVEDIFPDVLDYNYWKNMAIAQGQYVSGNKIFTQGSTSSGIWFVDGNVTLNRGITINGTLIVLGNISVSDPLNMGHFTINAPAGQPAIVCAGNFNADHSSWLAVNGLLYVVGNLSLDLALSPQVRGSIVVGGNVSMQSCGYVCYIYDRSYILGLQNFSLEFSRVKKEIDWKES